MTTDLISYYKVRAAEYDTVYQKPERQDALAEATTILQDILSEKEVLEIACGTSYWTEHIAETAKSILATDINETMLELARQRSYPRNNVTFQLADFYHFKNSHQFESLFGGFIWSHIKLEELSQFVDVLSTYLKPGGTLVFIDNNYVEGSNLPITKTDEHGNTYQTRRVQDEQFLVLKNFPTEGLIKKLLAGSMTAIKFMKLQYYWILVTQKL